MRPGVVANHYVIFTYVVDANRTDLSIEASSVKCATGVPIGTRDATEIRKSVTRDLADLQSTKPLELRQARVEYEVSGRNG